MVKRCVWGTCNSDSRYADRFCGQFNPFPKPKTRLDACKRWIKACGRRHLDINKVNKHTYVCSKHFENGVGPTGEHPDPVAADGADPVLRRSPKRKTPVQAIRMDGTSIILHDAELEPCLKQGVNKLYKDQILCDVTLTSNDGVDLQAHWLVLAAHSGFLQHVAVNQITKHSMMTDSGKLKLDMESKVLKLMVDYLYCGELVVTKDCLDKVKQAVKLLQLSRAADLLHQACLSETSQLTNTKEQPHVPTQRPLLPKPQPLIPKQRPQVLKKFAIDSTLLKPAGSPVSSPHQFKPIILSVESLKGSPTTALANPLSKSTNLHIPDMQGRSSLLDWSHGQSHGSTGDGDHLLSVPVDKSPGEECSLRIVKNKGHSTFSKHPCVSPEDNDECKTAPSGGGQTVQSWRKGLSKLVVGSTISNKSNNHPGMVSSGSFSSTGDQRDMNLGLVKTEHSYAESDDLDYTIYENMDTSDTDSCQGSLVSEEDAFPDQDMSSSAQSTSSSAQSTSSSAQSTSSSPQSISSSPRCRSSSAQGPSSSAQRPSSSPQSTSSSPQSTSSSAQRTSSSAQSILSSPRCRSSFAQGPSSSVQSTSSSAQCMPSSAQSTSSSTQNTSSSVQGPSSSAQGPSSSAQSTSSSAQSTSSSAQRTSSSSSAYNDQTKAKRSVNAEECLYVGNPLTSKLQSHTTQESKPNHRSSVALTGKYLHSQDAHEQDKIDTASNFPCKLCEETFKNLSDLKYHCLSKHLSTAMKRPKLNIHVKSSKEPTASPKQCSDGSDGRNRSSACSRRDEMQTEVYPDHKEECFGQEEDYPIQEEECPIQKEQCSGEEEECPIQEEECPIQEECCGQEEDNHNHEEICPGQQKEFSGPEEEECRSEGRISKTVDQADDNSLGSQAGQTPADSSSTQLPITSNRNGKRPRLTSDATIQEGIHISCLNKPRHPSTNCGQPQPTPDLKKPGKKKKKVEGTIHDYIAGGYYIEGGAVL